MVFSAFSYAGLEGEAGTSHQRTPNQYGFTPEQFKWLEQEVEQMKEIGKRAFWPDIISAFNIRFQTFFLRDKYNSKRFAASYNNRYRGTGKKAYEAQYESHVENFVWHFIEKDLEIHCTVLAQIYSNRPQINWVLLVSTHMQGYNPRAVSRAFFRRDTAKAKVVERLQHRLQQETSERMRVRIRAWIDLLTADTMQHVNDEDAQNVQNTQETQEGRGVKRPFEQIDANESQAGVRAVCGSESPRSYETYEPNQYRNDDEYRELIMRGTQEGPGVRLSQMSRNSLNCSEPPTYYIPSELMSPMLMSPMPE